MLTKHVKGSYSFSTTPRIFTGRVSQEIDGKAKNYAVRIPPKPETPKINSKRLHIQEQPNTNRTLIPAFNKERENTMDSVSGKEHSHRLSYAYNKSSGLVSPNSKNSLISYDMPQRKIRQKTSDTFKSFDFSGSSTDRGSVTKRLNRESPFDIYTSTTQIYALPGGVKRKERLKVRMNDTNKDSINMKYNSDYSSKVSCLPGTMTKKVPFEPVVPSRKIGIRHANDETKENTESFRKGRSSAGCFIGKESKSYKNEWGSDGRKKFPGKNNFTSQFQIC